MAAPKLALRDPYAVRGAVVVLLVASFFGATGEHWRRIAAAFDWHGFVAPANFRIDAWVTPPAYTGRPPILLPGVRPGEQAQAAAAVAVPAGSKLVVRATGSVHLDLATSGGLEAVKASQAPVRVPRSRATPLPGDGAATLRPACGDIAWQFQAIPDSRQPSSSPSPRAEARGSLRLNYKLEDDYGVIAAEASFSSPTQSRTAARPPHPLYGPPNFALSLPQARTRNGNGQTIKDVTEHPWAGTEVTMTLTARDGGGNEGHSAAHGVQLPERIFVKPLARALIEQRRDLARDAEDRGTCWSRSTRWPWRPIASTPAGVYLGLRSIYWKLGLAKTDDELREVVDRLWDMAVTIEDGNLSDVEKALRAAEDALRQALDRGASEPRSRS